MAKYDPLGSHLVAAADRGEHTLTMTFGEVDRLVGGIPPSSSRRQWWANGSNTQALAWRAAGWHVQEVDLPARRVTFARGRVGGSDADRGYHPVTTRTRATPAPRNPLGEHVDLRVRFEWFDAGHVVLDAGGKPAFGVLPEVPGIYRFTFSAGSEGIRDSLYVGETDNLKRRAGHYRNPGPTQQTNIRINARLREHLGAGGSVAFAVATKVEVSDETGRWESLDLQRKASRLLAENVALGNAQRLGDCNIENLG